MDVEYFGVQPVEHHILKRVDILFGSTIIGA